MNDHARFCPAPHARVLAVPAFSDNYLWLIRDAQQRLAAVVDPGDASAIEAALSQGQLKLVAILLTHHHADHAGGVAALKARWGCPVYGPAAEDIAGVDHPLNEGAQVSLPELGLSFQVFEVPGHTRGHIAYFSPDLADDARPALFCGDTLFAAGCGRVFEGTPAQMLESLSKLAALPGETLIYCAHEYTLSNLKFACAVEPDNPRLLQRMAQATVWREQGRATVPSLMSEEWATNPFLRTKEASVQAAASARLGAPVAGPTECFAEIRAWKNVFR